MKKKIILGLLLAISFAFSAGLGTFAWFQEQFTNQGTLEAKNWVVNAENMGAGMETEYVIPVENIEPGVNKSLASFTINKLDVDYENIEYLVYIKAFDDDDGTSFLTGDTPINLQLLFNAKENPVEVYHNRTVDNEGNPVTGITTDFTYGPINFDGFRNVVKATDVTSSDTFDLVLSWPHGEIVNGNSVDNDLEGQTGSVKVVIIARPENVTNVNETGQAYAMKDLGFLKIKVSSIEEEVVSFNDQSGNFTALIDNIVLYDVNISSFFGSYTCEECLPIDALLIEEVNEDDQLFLIKVIIDDAEIAIGEYYIASDQDVDEPYYVPFLLNTSCSSEYEYHRIEIESELLYDWLVSLNRPVE